jgi:hypothetical protein
MLQHWLTLFLFVVTLIYQFRESGPSTEYLFARFGLSDFEAEIRIRTQTLDAILKTKEQLDKIENKENLGEEVFSKDGKPEKVRYKAQSDNGVDKLHPARGNRLPIDHPKHWFKKLVPKRRETVIRNFPMDHLGLTGKVSEATL